MSWLEFVSAGSPPEQEARPPKQYRQARHGQPSLGRPAKELYACLRSALINCTVRMLVCRHAAPRGCGRCLKSSAQPDRATMDGCMWAGASKPIRLSTVLATCARPACRWVGVRSMS